MSTKKKTYVEAMAEVNDIVANIENGTYDIDELAEKVKRVSQLITFCRQKLTDTEMEVENIIRQMGNPEPEKE